MYFYCLTSVIGFRTRIKNVTVPVMLQTMNDVAGQPVRAVTRKDIEKIRYFFLDQHYNELQI